MGCFRQIFQCMKAPFTRKQRGLQIVSRSCLFCREDQPLTRIMQGHPTDFRREELPACFSDAESVLSPSQTRTERPNLTKQPQHVDVSGQPPSDSGEGRHDYRDGHTLEIVEAKDPEPSLNAECQGDTKPRLRDRMSPSRWFKSKPRPAEPSTVA